MSVGTAVRTTVRTLGELSITAGVVVLLFCGYELVWTNVETERVQHQLRDELVEDWQRGGGVGAVAQTEQARPRKVRIGDGMAVLRIPRLGDNWAKVIVEGVTDEALAAGPGHYPDTALPGEVGNFAVAGHRMTNGEPFRQLDELKPGDPVVVETRDTWFTYVVDRTEIVAPTAVDVVAPVPGRPGAKPTERLFTMTTCNPEWSSYERLIVFTKLESTLAKDEGTPAALAG